jgi:hypothetical protein
MSTLGIVAFTVVVCGERVCTAYDVQCQFVSRCNLRIKEVQEPHAFFILNIERILKNFSARDLTQQGPDVFSGVEADLEP